MPAEPSERRSDPFRSRSSIRTGAWGSPEWKATRPPLEAENAAKAAAGSWSTPSATGLASPVTVPAARSKGCAIRTDSRTKRRWPDAYSACVTERTTSFGGEPSTDPSKTAFRPACAERARKRKRRPSGRKRGWRCEL